jgi:hypothetical protein
MSAHTPGPWTVKFAEARHRKGSPICLERCGRGAVPVRIKTDSHENATRSGYPNELELHVLLCDFIDDVMAADGTHVVCTGHDYNDGGYVSVDDARLIAAAPDLLAACKEYVDKWTVMDEDEKAGVDALRAAIAKAEGTAIT